MLTSDSSTARWRTTFKRFSTANDGEKDFMTTELIEKTMRTDYFVELENQYGAHNYHPLDVVIERAEGVWVYDVEGKRYLDCLAAYSAVNQGHCHPRILQTLIEQAH